LIAQKIVLLGRQKIVLLEVLEAESRSARRVDLDDARSHAYLISTGYRHAVGGAPFGSKIAVLASFDAILISSLSCGTRRPPRIMPAKNTATTVKTITPSFRGGRSPRTCLSKSWISSTGKAPYESGSPHRESTI
jgi:hypothetical protein